MTKKHPWYFLCALFIIGSNVSNAEDWPMWRCDANRSAVSPQKLPEKLHLQWVRKYPRVKPAFGSRRLQFDAGYEPVIMGKTLFVGSPCNDTVTAIDTETGAEKWKFYSDGPVRFAPVAWIAKVFAASDDGCLYCLEAATGKLLWKFRAVPSNRKILGNGRMMSVVTDEGCIYCFGAKAVSPKRYEVGRTLLQTKQDSWNSKVKRMLSLTGTGNGYALVLGVGTGRLIVSEDLSAAGFSRGTAFVKTMFESLRPYGAAACLSIPKSRRKVFSKWVRRANLANAELEQIDDLVSFKRVGALPGTSNYTGLWSRPDELVKAPLGVLWFDDSVRLFKRSPQPKIIDGVMISQPKAWLMPERPYSLEAPAFADVYTGRVSIISGLELMLDL